MNTSGDFRHQHGAQWCSAHIVEVPDALRHGAWQAPGVRPGQARVSDLARRAVGGSLFSDPSASPYAGSCRCVSGHWEAVCGDQGCGL